MIFLKGVFAKFWFLVVLLASSCQTMYIPNAVNVPLLSQADEFQTCVTVGGSGYGAQLAYSPFPYCGVIGSGTFNQIRNDSSLQTTFSHFAADIGAGMYLPLNTSVRAELYFGYGAGKTSEFARTDKYRRFFLQPNFGISEQFFDLGLSSGFSFVNYFDAIIAGGTIPQEKKAFFWEPSVTFRGGYEQLKFSAQAQFTVPISGEDFDGRYMNWALNFGVHITFGKDFEMYSRP